MPTGSRASTCSTTGAIPATGDDYLAAMDHKHRKNIRQERSKVARAGVTFRVLHGDEASDDDLATMYLSLIHI